MTPLLALSDSAQINLSYFTAGIILGFAVSRVLMWTEGQLTVKLSRLIKQDGTRPTTSTEWNFWSIAQAICVVVAIILGFVLIDLLDQPLPRLMIYATGGFVLGATSLVAAQHFWLWTRDMTRALPFHVWTVALSYDLMVVALMTRTGNVDWRAYIYVPGLLLGCVAMMAMFRHQRLRFEEGSHATE